LGEGPPLVMLFPYHINHLALNWEVELHRSGIEHLARHFTVVNLDFSGAGLSAGKLHGLSWDAFDADIGSVLDSLAIPGNA
ncbi:MAG TPA: hypothetical protein VKA43_12840, partial [Gammaproteobacteria bacterium]|nr:hypothetical protein [Gammaproteobacteria bacterium]